MSAATDRMLKLMAYADGELEGAELAEVEGWLVADADAARFTAELAQLGDFVKTGHVQSAKAAAIASFDVAGAVMARVEAEPEKAEKADDEPKAPVVSLEARREEAKLRQAPPRRRMQVGMVVAAALALAASVFVFSRNATNSEQPMARIPVAPVELASAGPGVDVDVDETPGQSVSVFYVPNETMATTTSSVVVWVDESGGQ